MCSQSLKATKWLRLGTALKSSAIHTSFNALVQLGTGIACTDIGLLFLLQYSL
jgi:hypothetical protein